MTVSYGGGLVDEYGGGFDGCDDVPCGGEGTIWS